MAYFSMIVLILQKLLRFMLALYDFNCGKKAYFQTNFLRIIIFIFSIFALKPTYFT